MAGRMYKRFQYSRPWPALLSLAIALLCGSGCIQWFKGPIATGVARLTINNVATMLLIVNDDATCGFSSDAVKYGFDVQETSEGRGIVTWRVQECTIDLGRELTKVSEGCQGDTHARGRITVSATMKVEGRLTGSLEQPVVPESHDAATIRMDRVTFENFEVGGANRMTMKAGALSAVIQPTLVQSDVGVCSVISQHVLFRNVQYEKASVRISTGGRNIDVDVGESNILAFNGWNETYENHMEGFVRVWGKRKGVPDDSSGLNPDYNRETFEEAFACVADLALPVERACDLHPTLAGGTARLSIQTLAALASIAAQEDNDCGFFAQASLDNIQTVGDVGRPGGRGTVHVEDCHLSYPEPTVISEDCRGNQTIVQGRATLSGDMVIDGWLTGGDERPVVPEARDAAMLHISATVDEFKVSSSASDIAFTMHQGSLSGTVNPRAAIDESLGVCALVTPVAQVTDVAMTEVQATIEIDGTPLSIDVQDSDLWAVNGERNDIENKIGGQIVLETVPFEIPDDDNDLDPSYDREKFLGAYSCEENLRIAQSDRDCNLKRVLAENAGRLILLAVGYMISEAEMDPREDQPPGSCGYYYPDEIIPESVVDLPDGRSTMTWDLANCTIPAHPNGNFLHDIDCNGEAAYLDGQVTMSATKTITGLVNVGDPPLLPQNQFGDVIFSVHNAEFSDFAVRAVLADGSEAPYGVIRSGRAQGTMRAVPGASIANPGAFTVVNSTSEFNNIIAEDIAIDIHMDGMMFSVFVEEAVLYGFNGRFGNRENDYRGTVRIEGDTIHIPETDVDGPYAPLDPDFSYEDFVAAYACDPDLLEPIQ